MKTTIEIPDDLFRRSKAIAALRGEPLKELVSQALREHLEHSEGGASRLPGWRNVFGRAPKAAVEEIDAILEEEFGKVDPDEWQ